MEMDYRSWRSKREEKEGIREREKKKDRESESYMFAFQMKEKVYLEPLNSFCEVKKAEQKTRPNTGLFFFNYS